jgi:diguanylate cyclase (GGDEF)-like protein
VAIIDVSQRTGWAAQVESDHAHGSSRLRKRRMRARGSALAGIQAGARLGGDEFMVELGEIHGLADAQGPAAKLVEVPSEPFFINDLTLRLSTSIGISIYPDDAETVDALISIADYALYEAKRSGKNRFCSTARPPAKVQLSQSAELAPHR